MNNYWTFAAKISPGFLERTHWPTHRTKVSLGYEIYLYFPHIRAYVVRIKCNSPFRLYTYSFCCFTILSDENYLWFSQQASVYNINQSRECACQFISYIGRPSHFGLRYGGRIIIPMTTGTKLILDSTNPMHKCKCVANTENTERDICVNNGFWYIAFSSEPLRGGNKMGI